MTKADHIDTAVGILANALALTCLAAYATHMIVCIQSAQWGWVIVAALFTPLGIYGGFTIWF